MSVSQPIVVAAHGHIAFTGFQAPHYSSGVRDVMPALSDEARAMLAAWAAAQGPPPLVESSFFRAIRLAREAAK